MRRLFYRLSSCAQTSGFIEHSVSEHAEAADHKTGVLQELPDGSGFVIDVGILGVPKCARASSIMLLSFSIKYTDACSFCVGVCGLPLDVRAGLLSA